MELYDPFRFHLIQFLDFDEIVKLARTNQRYAKMLHDPDLYVHLLERDYGITQQVDDPEIIYRKLKMGMVLEEFVRHELEKCNLYLSVTATITDPDKFTLDSPHFDFGNVVIKIRVLNLLRGNSRDYHSVFSTCMANISTLIFQNFGYDLKHTRDLDVDKLTIYIDQS